MQQPDITSRDNARIKYACKLAQSAAFRQSERSFLAEGSKLCLELAKTCPLKVLYTTARALEHTPALAALNGERFTIADHVAEKLAGVPSSQGVFGVFGFPAPAVWPVPGGRYLALENVQDPGNVGTIWRTADALGADGLILVGNCADPYSPKVVRSSMGACFRLPVYETDAGGLCALLERSGIPLSATALREDTVSLEQARLDRAAVIIGSEGSGVSPELLARSGQTIKIPMRERCESLNAAAAAAIVLWEMARNP